MTRLLDKAGLQKGDIITKLGDNDIYIYCRVKSTIYIKYDVRDTVEYTKYV